MLPENQNIYNYSMIGMAAVIWFILYKLLAFIIGFGSLQSIFVPGEATSTLVPFVLGLAGAGGAFYGAKQYEPANRFGLEVIAEMRKVVWPTRTEVTGTTSAVLVFILLTVVILFIFDKIFQFLVISLVQ